MKEICNYITCPKGHKVYVIWSPAKQRFGFTCDECQQHSEKAMSVAGVVEVRLVEKPREQQ